MGDKTRPFIYFILFKGLKTLFQISFYYRVKYPIVWSWIYEWVILVLLVKNGLLSKAVSLVETLQDIVRNSPSFNCSKLFKIVKKNSKLFKTLQNCSKLFKIVQHCLNCLFIKLASKVCVRMLLMKIAVKWWKTLIRVWLQCCQYQIKKKIINS